MRFVEFEMGEKICVNEFELIKFRNEFEFGGGVGSFRGPLGIGRVVVEVRS